MNSGGIPNPTVSRTVPVNTACQSKIGHGKSTYSQQLCVLGGVCINEFLHLIGSEFGNQCTFNDP